MRISDWSSDVCSSDLMGIDRATGAIRWTKQFELPLWGSPVVVDDVLLMGDCSGFFHAWDVSDTAIDPPQLWQLELGGCIEAPPAAWKGQTHIGTRRGPQTARAPVRERGGQEG